MRRRLQRLRAFLLGRARPVMTLEQIAGELARLEATGADIAYLVGPRIDVLDKIAAFSNPDTGLAFWDREPLGSEALLGSTTSFRRAAYHMELQRMAEEQAS